jgi:hypothetical protein
MADQPNRGPLAGEAGARVGRSDVLPDRVARAAMPALHALAARRRLARSEPLDVRPRQPLAGELDRPHPGRPRLPEPRTIDRPGRAVVVIAKQRQRAALARPSHDPVGVRAAPNHVPERPKHLHTAVLRGADDGLQRLDVSVLVAEHGDEHSRNRRELLGGGGCDVRHLDLEVELERAPRAERDGLRHITLSYFPGKRSTSSTASITNHARWSSGDHSRSEGGIKNACSRAHSMKLWAMAGSPSPGRTDPFVRQPRREAVTPRSRCATSATGVVALAPP